MSATAVSASTHAAGPGPMHALLEQGRGQQDRERRIQRGDDRCHGEQARLCGEEEQESRGSHQRGRSGCVGCADPTMMPIAMGNGRHPVPYIRQICRSEYRVVMTERDPRFAPHYDRLGGPRILG